MRIKKIAVLFVIVIILSVIGVFMVRIKKDKTTGEEVKEITPFVGAIRNLISSTATVLPKNRLEIKPPVNGRIERILTQEGDKVKAGQILAWMSSTERAALIDAARGKGEDSLKYWEETYKAIPLPAPIDGEVIVAKTQPGQAVTTADAVVVISDRLIVRAQVDETDIGKIAPEMKAVISLDAYPDTKINALVSHIYYESKTVNNVTIYEVDLIPEKTPSFFRSGMNAAVDFIEKSKEQALLIPADAVHREKEAAYCFVKQSNGTEPVKARLILGISDDKNVEVLSGLTEKDRILLKSTKYSLPRNTRGKNPFTSGH